MAEENNYFTVDASNTKAFNTWGFWSSGGGIDLVYNGINVVYFPKSYVEKGFTTGTLGGYAYPESGGYVNSSGNVLWFGNGTFLNQATWDYLKPTKLDQSLIDILGPNTRDPKTYQAYWNVTGQTYQTAFDMRNVPNFSDGYIIEKSKFDELAKASSNSTNSSDGRIFGWSPYRIPSAMGTAPDGNLSYVGYTTGGANDRRSDLYYINNSDSAKYGYMQYSWQDCGIFGCSFSDFLSSTLGQLVILGARIINPWFNLGYTIGDVALRDGKIGDVALAVINLNTPTPGGTTPAAGTVFEIPQIAKATSTIAGAIQSTGVITDAAKAAEAAKLIMNTGLTYLSNGQDFNKAFLSAAGTLLGQQASQQLVSSLSVQSADIAKIMTATTTATTKAMLLNQDVQKAAMSAFVSTSIPLALDGALKDAGLTLTASAKKVISDAATAAALLPNANVSEVIKSAVAGTLIDGAVSKVTGELISAGVITSTDTAMFDKIKNYIGPLLNGRSVDELMNSSIVADAIKAADLEGKNFVAKDKGWSDWATWQNAKSLFGSTVTPQFYEDRVVSPEKIIKILDQENVPVADRQNIIDFYKGVVGKDATAEQVLADVRRFVNPLYFTQAEEQYLNNVFSKIEGFDSDYYKEEYAQAITAAKKGDFTAVERIAEYVNKDYTSTTEATSLLKEAFSAVGEPNYEPTADQIAQIRGYNQPTAYTIAQNMAALKATTFDGKGYATPQEASAAAKQNGYNVFEASDGKTYKVISVLSEAEIRANIESKATFSEAFAAARAELGAGRTFIWEGKQYTTNVVPPGVFDGSRSSTVEVAATLAHSKGQDRFIGPDGKIYALNDQAKSILDNAVNQSPAETQRLLRQAVAPMPDETKAETQRLMDAGTRGTMDTISAITSQVLGTTQRGIANLLINGGKTYASITGDLTFENAATRLGNEIEQYARSNDVYGLDIQKERIQRAIALSNERGEERLVERVDEFGNVTTSMERPEKSFWEKSAIIGNAIKGNVIGFFDIAGSEIVEEIPETIVQIAATLATGGASLAATGAVAAISAAGSIVETFGTSTESAYREAKRLGFSESQAIDKGYLNGMVSTLIEIGPEIAADKMLVGSLIRNTGNSLVNLGTGLVSNAAMGAANGLVTGTGQSWAEQLIVNPNTASFSKALSDGIFEASIGGSVQAGMFGAGYSLNSATVIGKDYNGADVTLADVLQGGKVIDSSTLKTDAQLVTTENNNMVTLGGILTVLPESNFSSEIQKTYLPQIFDNPNLVVGQDALGNNVTFGQVSSRVTQGTTYTDVFNSIVNQTPEAKREAQKSFLAEQFRSIGYEPTEKQLDNAVIENPSGNQSVINNAKRTAFTEIAKQENFNLTDQMLEQLVSSGSTINTAEDFKAFIDPNAVTADEAREFLANKGYTTPTEEQINRVMAEGTEGKAGLLAAEIADPYYFDSQEIRDIAAQEGRTLTDEEVAAEAKEGIESELASAFRQKIDPQAVIRAEAADFFTQFQYEPNEAELAQFIASKSENEVQSDIQRYVDGKQVTRAEAEAFFANTPYKPTEADILRYIQQGPEISQADIERQITEFADVGTVTEQEVKDAYAALGLKKPTQADIAQLIGQYSEAELAGRAEAGLPQARINSIFEQLDSLSSTASPQVLDSINKVRSDLLSQLESMGVDVSNIAREVTGVTQDVTQLRTDLLYAIESARQEGLTGDAALQRAIDTVAGDLGTTKSDVLSRLGSTESALRTELATQIGGIQTQITDVESRLSQAIADARAAGLTGDAALQDAINKVSSDLGTTRESVLGELGKTEANLRQDFATQLGGISQQFETAQASILAKMAENERAGQDRDTALQNAIDSVSNDLGTTRSDLLSRLGTTESNLRQEFTTQMERQEQQTRQQIQASETTILQRMQEYERNGQDRDTALNNAINDVATDLGLTRNQIATQIGTQAVVDDPNTPENEARPATGIYGLISGFDEQARLRQKELEDQIAANEAARVAAEAERARQAQSKDLFQRASGLLGVPLLAGLAAPTAAAPETQYQWKKPFITSTGKQEEFKGSLADFQKEVEEGSYLQPSFAEEGPGVQEYMGMEENRQEGESMPNYFTYGDQTDIDQIFNPFGPQATSFNEFEPFMAATGGLVPPLMAGGGSTRYGRYAGGGLPVVEHSGKARLDFRTGAAVTGPGDGQSDDIPAMLADGEYVLDAEIVAALGNGSTKAGSKLLDEFRQHIRQHKRSGSLNKIPPKAKSPLEYLSMAKRSIGRK